MIHRTRSFSWIMVSLPLLIMISCSSPQIEDVQREFAELRFGMFLHFGIRTFTGGKWGEANQDITRFAPDNLDCGQWADAAAAAHMKFGILTTKHHDGFCLWNSAYSDFDVANIPWRNGTGDVVREYVDAFRSRGLEPSLYYSVWDNTEGIGNGPVTEAHMDIIKGQLTELLSNYGDIPMLFIDGWSWKTGHVEVPYPEIHALVRELQPRCLLVDNTHLPCLYHNDLIHYEAGGSCPEDNRLPALLSKRINTHGGNGWFWNPEIPEANLMDADTLHADLLYLEPRWCTYILNCPPNTDGRLDTNIVNRLEAVGKLWFPDLSRPELPEQHAQIETYILPDTATASSGDANRAIDAKNDRYNYSVWESSGNLPQSFTLRFNRIVRDINMLYYIPKYVPIVSPREEGSIQSYRLDASLDGTQFTEITRGEWNGDAKMKVAVFSPVNTRYIRLEILTAVDGFAAATEIAVGRGSSGEVPAAQASSSVLFHFE